MPPSNHAGGFPSSLDHLAQASCGEGASATRPSSPAPVVAHGDHGEEVGVALGGLDLGLAGKVAAEIGSLVGTEEWVAADLEAELEEELQTEMVHLERMELNNRVVAEMGMGRLVEAGSDAAEEVVQDLKVSPQKQVGWLVGA